MLATSSPFPQYFDIDGSPLDAGKLYFGTVSLDPQTNPIAVYWDAAGTIPAAQPIRTLNGYTARNGTPSLLFVSGAYSLMVRDKQDRQVVYAPTSVEFDVLGQAQAAASALTIDLANAASAANGAGQVGFGPTLTYGTGSTGRALQLGGVTPSMFGAVGDGVTDDTAAMQAWAASAFPKIGEPKTFKVMGVLTFAANAMHVDGRGMTIDGSAGTFSNSAVLYCTGSLSAIPDLSVSPSEQNRGLTFATAHGLTARDVFLIFNPTASSWSVSRPEYYAGEFAEVAAVLTPTTLRISGGLYAGYTAANVDLYKLARNDVSLRGLKVIAPATGTMSPIRVRLATRVRFENVQGHGSDYAGFNFDRCYDVDVSGCNVTVPVQVAATKYGISVGNSQHVRIRGCHLEAVRHAVSIGGDNFTGSVPNRDVWVSDSYLANDVGVSGVACADVHGNSQHIYYVKCQIKGGGSFGGRDCHYWGCDFHEFDSNAGAIVQGGSEWVGGVAEVRGGSMFSLRALSLGMVRLSTDASVDRESTLIVEGVSVTRMPLCDTFARCDLTASTHKVNAVIRNITFMDGAPTLSNVLRMVGTGAAGDGNFIIVDGIDNAKAGATLYTATNGYGSTVKCRLMRQDGTAGGALLSGQPVSSFSATFRLSYGSKVPRVQALVDTRIVGTNPLAVAYRLKSGTGVTFDVFTTNNANAGATPTVAVDYSAGLSEI